MKKFITWLLLSLATTCGWATDSTWSFVWNTSRSSGGEGFYNISDHSAFTQVQTLNGLQWTLQSDSYATGYTATSGQYFGTAANPITEGTLSTAYLKGKIKKVTIRAKVKSEGQVAKIGVAVGGKSYGDAVTLTTDTMSYDFLPTDNAEEGDIVISFEQKSETKGIIYFFAMSIVYDGEGIVKPVVEKIDPALDYATKEVTLEAGDGPFTNPITNIYDVSPITYTSSDSNIAYVSSLSGQVHSMGAIGTATITAVFAGNDNYLADTASYVINVIAKPVIPAPEVDVKGGTFNEPVTVTITSNDPLCKAIWYSTTLTNVDDMGYDDQTIIVPGNKAEAVIDHTCTLLCVAVGDNNIGLPVSYDFTVNIPLKADFTADESATTYYSMGWDSVEEATTWKYYGINSNYTWTLTEGAANNSAPSFTTIDPESKYSLSIFYDQYNNQKERAVSPEIVVEPNSRVDFYACFSGVWLYWGYWKLLVNDLTAGTQDLLINSFLWAQDNAYTGPSWEKFTVGLSKYAGHTCTFEFDYEGCGGEDVSIDNFKLLKEDKSDDAKITIMQGQQVHFQDVSAGQPDSWTWTFEGGEPSTSTKKSPVVTYNKAGKYTVTLTAKKGNETSTKTREAYVVVNVESPKAHIGIPDAAYLSPWAYAFVPTNVPLTFKDLSTGSPDTWAWTFEGTDVATSSEQNPVVTYTSEGTYGLELTVSNAAGSDRDFLVDAIKAGGAEDVWNIEPEETNVLSEIYLGYYGYYAGTNWLGMTKFAEHFHKPLVSATIDNVTAYFANTTAEDQNALIEVSICNADANRMPGEVLATTSLKVSELQCSPTDVVPTVFTFEQPVSVSKDFFVVISGFPNSGYYDDVTLFCVYRGGDNKNTTYHYLLDEDENYQFLDTGKWYENTDDPLSMCLTAHLSYTNTDGINNVSEESNDKKTTTYTIDGKVVSNTTQAHGIYIIRNGNTVRKVIR
ncbi:MAG: PKD domain-containing protein [Prevotellaceae bacterium]|nr:PKD domain-containing protein [Prevotellaceae bacterium]